MRRYIMAAIPGACGFTVVTGDACPAAVFEVPVSEGDEVMVTGMHVNVTTESADGGVALVSVDAGVYEGGTAGAVVQA